MSEQSKDSKEIDLQQHDQQLYQWSSKIESALDIIRINCINLSGAHEIQYNQYRNKLKYFRIPIIILSAFNSFVATGMQNYMKQPAISTTNTVLSLICSIILSIELYLDIQKKMENELLSHKSYYKLSIDICKTISIERNKRKIDGISFHDDVYAEFLKIQQQSNVLETTYVDVMSRPISIIHPETPTVSPITTTHNLNMYDRIASIYSPQYYKRKKNNNKAINECNMILRKNYSQTLSDMEYQNQNQNQKTNIKIKPISPISPISTDSNLNDTNNNNVIMWNNNKYINDDDIINNLINDQNNEQNNKKNNELNNKKNNELNNTIISGIDIDN